jgi:hypothetical protein
MVVKSMETAEEGTTSMEMVGGTSPSRQGAGIETSVPQNLSSMAAVLQNYSGKMPIVLGFSFGRLFIGRGAALEVHQGGLTTPGHGQEGGAPAHGEDALWPPSSSHLVLVLPPGKIGASFGFCFIQFREYFLCSFSETQK